MVDGSLGGVLCHKGDAGVGDNVPEDQENHNQCAMSILQTSTPLRMNGATDPPLGWLYVRPEELADGPDRNTSTTAVLSEQNSTHLADH